MKNQMKRIGALLTAVMMILAMAVPAMAQDSYTAINGDNTSVTINQSLDRHDSAFGPSHTTTFTTTYVGNQMVGAAQAHEATGVPPVVTLSFDTSGAARTAKLDFTGVSFPAPGIYRFLLSETAISDPAVTRVAGSESSYYVDVYVTNVTTATGASALQIDKYAIYPGSAVAQDNATKAESADFANEYTSFKLDVAKNVTGNQGDKTKEFTITVNFTGGKANDKYSVRWAAGTPKVAGTGLVSGTPVDVALDASGAATVTLQLKDTDQVEFYGIPSGVNYTVTEADYSAAGYTTTGQVSTATALTADASVTITDEKSGTIPTGLFLNYKPFWIMGAVAIFLAVLFLGRRRDRFAEMC